MKSTYLLLKTLCVAACLVLSGVTTALAKEALPMAQDPVLEKRLILISEELRCLVCQNESLASSRAELANDLREEVRKLITQNLSDQQIKDYLVTRYGDFVLYRPQVKPLTWVLWFGPFLLLVVALWGMFSYVRQRLSAQTTVSVLSDADRHKAQAILNSGDAP
jgi:cytochrome c-type biogenesis protein CcmH